MPGYVGFFTNSSSAAPQTVCTSMEAQPNILTCEALGDQGETGGGIHEAATAAVNETTVEVVNVDRGTSTGGTFTLTVDGEDSGAIAFDAAAATVETAVEAITGVTAVSVTGTGTVADPWVITFVDLGPKVVSGDGASLTGGNSTLTVTEVTAGYDGVKAADTAITYDTLVGVIPTKLPAWGTIENERIKITSFTSTVLTVERGVQGTVAANHADDTAISIDGHVLPQPNKVVYRVVSEDQVAKAWAGLVNDVGDLDDSQTDVTYDGGSGTKPTVPFVIKINDERMKVTADSGTVFTVVRAFGGTTATVHSNDDAISTSILAADLGLAATAVTGLEAASGYPSAA